MNIRRINCPKFNAIVLSAVKRTPLICMEFGQTWMDGVNIALEGVDLVEVRFRGASLTYIF